MKPQTMRDRIRAILEGRDLDRVPFVQYDNVAAPNREIWSEIGRGNMGILRWTRLHRIEHPNCRARVERIEQGEREGRRTTIETPRGTMTEECLVEPTYGTASIRKHFVKDPDDYHALCAYIEDSVVIESQDGYNRAVQELGEDGLPLVRVERTPYQQLWIQWVSMEDFAGHLQDVPDRVRSCVDAMAVEQRRVFEIVARSPIPFANFPDNVTAPVIGDANFRTYCLPYYNELAAMLAERGVPVFVHMDGDLRPLWGAISESSIGGIDSLSPPPDNDTSAGDAASQWPEMRIFLNYPSSVHLEAPETIYRHTIGILEEAGRTGRLQIQISENVPPGVWRKSFPQIIRAIRDFPLA